MVKISTPAPAATAVAPVAEPFFETQPSAAMLSRDFASFNPAVTARFQRPAPVEPTVGNKRTATTLTSLAASAQLLSSQRGVVSAPELLDGAQSALTRAMHLFMRNSGERQVAERLLRLLDVAQTATPENSAVALVTQSFPDHQSQCHGVFKGIARVIDDAIKQRETERTQTLDVALGFVPIIGTLLDVHDLAEAVSHLRNHDEGALFEAAIAGAAFIPGLDCLKAGKSAAGKHALRAAAEDLPEVARKGLGILSQKIGADAVAVAEKRVRVFNVARTELIARIEATAAQVPQNLRGLLDKAKSSLSMHAQPNDVVGAMRDRAGVPVMKSAEEAFDHMKEVNNALDSVQNALESVELKTASARHFLEGALRDCERMLTDILELP